MATSAFSGAYANVVSGSTDMAASGWTLDPEANTFDGTTTADLGWDNNFAATSKASGTFDFFYNPTVRPTGSSAGLTPGLTATLTLYVNKSLYPSETFSGSALITKLSLKSKVKDGFMVTASFVSKGAWTYPSP